MKCNVRDARKNLNLSVRDLERLTGINRGRLSLIENGIYHPTIIETNAIAKAIGKPVELWIDVEPREIV